MDDQVRMYDVRNSKRPFSIFRKSFKLKYRDNVIAERVSSRPGRYYVDEINFGPDDSIIWATYQPLSQHPKFLLAHDVSTGAPFDIIDDCYGGSLVQVFYGE